MPSARIVALLASVAIASAGALASCATQDPAAPPIAAASPGGPTMVAMRRLSESQYRNTIADLYGSDIELAARFEPDRRDGGLLAIGSVDLSISAGGFEQYMAMSRSIADQALNEKRRDKIASCKPADAKAADDKCVTEFIAAQGRRLFRRPLTEAEIAPRVSLARNAATQSKDYYTGLKLAFASLLTAPEFLFRIESAEVDPDKRRQLRLDGYSKAQRLSYLMWDTAPDEALLQAAASGEIHTEAGLQAQIDRLLASPRLENGVRAFFTDMLQLDLFESVTKDPAAYPRFSLAVANSAREQTLRTLVDHLVTRKGDYREVFTTPNTFINRSLAAIYDVPYLATAEWAPYRYPDNADQAGVLTQATFLSLFAHPNRTSPTKRGVALHEIFLCEPTPLPPADVDFSKVQDTKAGTIRERLLAHAENEGCKGCHSLSDPIGLALERFDGIGQPRTKENGKLIDVSVNIEGRKFDGAKGLGLMLRENPKVPACLVRNVYAYGVGRNPDDNAWELAFLERQSKAFIAGGYQMPAMMGALAASPDFYRVVFPATPAAAEPQSPEPAKIAATASTRLAGASQ